MHTADSDTAACPPQVSSAIHEEQTLQNSITASLVREFGLRAMPVHLTGIVADVMQTSLPRNPSWGILSFGASVNND